MVNYNLGEFKNWVNQNEQRKTRIPAHHITYFETNFGFWEQSCRNKNFTAYVGQQSHELILKWKSEVDEKQKSYENLKKINKLLLLNDNFDFSILQNEIKRLKIQDLTIQIPLKKQELEQLTNNLKSKLTRAEKYPLEKLIKKHFKVLQNNYNEEKLNELKEILSEKLTSEELKTILDKQKELYQLEKHLENLQNEQVAQIQQVNLLRNN